MMPVAIVVLLEVFTEGRSLPRSPTCAPFPKGATRATKPAARRPSSRPQRLSLRFTRRTGRTAASPLHNGAPACGTMPSPGRPLWVALRGSRQLAGQCAAVKHQRRHQYVSYGTVLGVGDVGRGRDPGRRPQPSRSALDPSGFLGNGSSRTLIHGQRCRTKAPACSVSHRRAPK